MPGLASLALKIAEVPFLAGADLESLYRLKPQRRLFKKGTALITAGAPQVNAFLICSGWVVCYRTLPSGDRQLVNILLPGDFAGIDAALTPMADRTAEALTAVTAFVLEPDCLAKFLKMDGKLGDVAIWSMIQEMSMITEHLCCVGRRAAPERVCHFLLELWIRLRQVELCRDDSFFIPVTLSDLADALGLSDVHLSRVLQRVREENLLQIDFAHHRVTVLDAAKAAGKCGFDPSYLKCQPKADAALRDIRVSPVSPLN
jgi:CRP-like cAMP-binding protein